MIVILPKRVSLLADQLSKILLIFSIFSIFSIKLELRDLSSKVENHTPKAKTLIRELSRLMRVKELSPPNNH